VYRLTRLAPSEVRELTMGELVAWINAESDGPGPQTATVEELMR
jgi:hypothetical protein